MRGRIHYKTDGSVYCCKLFTADAKTFSSDCREGNQDLQSISNDDDLVVNLFYVVTEYFGAVLRVSALAVQFVEYLPVRNVLLNVSPFLSCDSTSSIFSSADLSVHTLSMVHVSKLIGCTPR